MTPGGDGSTPKLIPGNGSLGTEQRLLDDLARHLDARGPVAPTVAWIVVPSNSLRLHLVRRLAERHPAGLLGVEVLTLHLLARRILQENGPPTTPGLDFYPLFARQLASDSEILQETLGPLRHGDRVAVETARDLLDAGLTGAHRDALTEAFEESDLGPREKDIGTAVVGLALETADRLDDAGTPAAARILLRAADQVLQGTSLLDRVAWLAIHGFAEATGAATDLLEALAHRPGARFYLDLPPDPARPESTPDWTHARRLRERIEPLLEIAERGPQEPEPELEFRDALGAEAEARGVAVRMRELLDAGVTPESIGVVARSLEPYRHTLGIQLRRYGVPFSGLGVRGGLTPSGRRVIAVLHLLEDGPEATIDRWFDARGIPFSDETDLRTALLALGAGRLGDLGRLHLDDVLRGDRYPLPVRTGLDENEGEPTHARRRWVHRERLESVLGEAARFLAHHRRWAAATTAAETLEALQELWVDGLSWDPDATKVRSLMLTIRERLAPLRPATPLRGSELHRLLVDERDRLAGAPFGGNGGGVQVLEVTEARGRTFEHLFVVGLNLGVFPRVITEDPLLPDDLRRRLRVLFPDIPVKREGYDEERYLFAQLLSAAPHVSLSWQCIDDENHAMTRSPLVERLFWGRSAAGRPLPEPERWMAGHDRRAEGARTAFEWAVSAGFDSHSNEDRAHWSRILETSLESAGEGRVDAGAVATARLEILAEFDPLPGDVAWTGLGPYLGMTRSPDEPRHAPESLWVTAVEALARCPWQGFLRHVLRLDPAPDPLTGIPGLSPLAIGNAVHGTLEAIVRRVRPTEAIDPAEATPTPVPWPDPTILDTLLLEASSSAAHREGVALPGYPRILAELAKPYLEIARQVDWPGGTEPHVLAAEDEGSIVVAGHTLRFRYDRADATAFGVQVTDYKTGRRVFPGAAPHRSPKQSGEKFAADVAGGEKLQAVAYGLWAAETFGRLQAEGRYVFLSPDIETDKDPRILSAASHDSSLVEAFGDAVGIVVRAHAAGLFPPRVVKPTTDEEPAACGWCAFASACVRGDSGFRRRLREFGATPAPADERHHEDFLSIWHLPDRRPGDSV